MAKKKSRKRRQQKARAKAASESPGDAKAPAVAAPKPAVSARRRRREDPEGAPPAPWGSFPLVEIAVLAGIIILAVGFFSSGIRQAILIGTGLVLCSVAGLELAIREHLAGYRSHTLVLAALPAVAVLAVLFYLGPAGLAPIFRLLIGALVFGACIWGFTVVFRNRSGGRTFRVKAPRRR
ncbi:MAG: hypothetical protein ACR2OC_05300 [Solirubrobacterales bacterium]